MSQTKPQTVEEFLIKHLEEKIVNQFIINETPIHVLLLTKLKRDSGNVFVAKGIVAIGDIYRDFEVTYYPNLNKVNVFIPSLLNFDFEVKDNE